MYVQEQMKKGRKRQFKQRKSEKNSREVPDAFRCLNGLNEN